MCGVCVHVCGHQSVYMQVCLCGHLCVCVCVCQWTSVCVYVHVCLSVCGHQSPVAAEWGWGGGGWRVFSLPNGGEGGAEPP